MKRLTAIISIFAMLLAFMMPRVASAQADTLLRFCASHIPSSYISDGQVYQTPISADETAEFHVTFYGGSTYRLAACSGLQDGNLVYTVYDSERNELFCSADHKNAPYWDFKFGSTVDCLIEARLSDIAPDSGFAILLIGFKN
ncbi:MAG: hypothetical protein J6T96_09065 [Bacteroidales bacterium]|nr:hypothetical protein [Bacteroidales bacterium]MBO7462732.1 hypothetical protein [Bacteroidales bacterium]